MTSKSWMIYGANGYTGALISEEAARRGWKPILAGRSSQALAALGSKLGLEHRVFSLDSVEQLTEQLRDVSLVLLTAGPFSHTSDLVVRACLARGIHYVDITGEIEVFESLFKLHDEAVRRGSVLLPGAGFDVVPTDCLAAQLLEKLPNAVRLELGILGETGPSQGTARTIVENLPHGGWIRQGGQLRKVPTAWHSQWIDFPSGRRWATTIPWGDVSTAYRSTKIDDIAVYLAMPPKVVQAMKLTRWAGPLLGTRPVQSLLNRAIDRWVQGPDEATRKYARTQLWGRVTDSKGNSVETTLVTPESYALTVQTTLAAVDEILAGKVKPGAWTPAQVFGARWIDGFCGTSVVS